MKYHIKSNSLVILANSHNASILTEKFLISSGILADLGDINKEVYIISPQFSQVVLKDETTILIDPNRLAISAKNNNRPYEIAQKYSETLKYINANAIGINFDIEINNFDSIKWFESLVKFQGSNCIEVKYKIKNCIITAKFINSDSIFMNFNFHYEIEKEKLLGEVKLDLIKEFEKNKTFIKKTLNSLQ